MTYTRKLSFEDYLALDNTGSEGLAELIDGELVELLPESGINPGIAACVYLELIRNRGSLPADFDGTLQGTNPGAGP